MRSIWKWYTLLAFATVLFYWKILLTDQFSLITSAEAINQAYSWFTFQVRMLQHGSLPVWDPFAFAGRSFPGEMQTGAFYPLNWLLALAPLNQHGLLSPRLYNEYFAFHHFLAAVFMFAFIRQLGLCRFPAFIAAACFSFSGFVAQVDWPHVLGSAIWLPLIFLFLLRAIEETRPSRSVWNAAMSGLLLGVSILAGGLHVTIMQALLLPSAVLYWAVNVRFKAGHWLWTAAVALVPLLVAGGIGAVQLFSSWEYAAHSIRFVGAAAPLPATTKIPYAFLQDGLFPQGIISLLFPLEKVGGGELWSPYIGVFPLMLALIGIWKQWSNTWVPYFAGVAVLFFLVAFGLFTPLHGLFYVSVPFLWMAREAGRFLYLTQFALCILTAYGLQSLLDIKSRSTEWWLPLRAAKWVSIAAGLLLFLPKLLSHAELNPWNAYSLILIVASCGMFTLLVFRTPTRGTLLLAALLVYIDLGAFNWAPRNKIEQAKLGRDFYPRLLSCEQASNYLERRHGLFRVSVEGDPAPNIGDAFGVLTIAGGGVTYESSFENMRPRPDLLNVRYRMAPANSAEAGEVYGDRDWKIFENANSYPHAWVVHSLVAPPAPASTQQLDLHRVAFLDKPSDVKTDPEIVGDPGLVKINAYEASRIELKISVKSAGLLVLSELFYPGWSARVNGREEPIYSVDGGLRAVPIPRGASAVEIRYAPRSILLGAILSIATLAAVLGSSFLVWLDGRRSSAISPRTRSQLRPV